MIHSRLALVLSLSMLLAQVPADLAAQSGASVQVTLIEVPVNVFDKSGNPVRGLKASDFELTDEGKKRAITHFEEIDLAQVVAANETPSPAARRNFMLLFDLSSSVPGTVSRARSAALDFVEEELTKNDVVAVATYSVESGFNLLTNFTADRATLVAAITTLGNQKYFKPADPLLLTATMNTPAGTSRSDTGGGKAAVDAIMVEESMANQAAHNRSNDDYQRGRVNKQLSTFANVARVLDSVTGRKQVILLSEGFDARLIQGKEADSQQSNADLNKVASGEIWGIDNDERFGSSASSSAVSQMGEVFRRSDVVLHAIDIKGLRTDVDAAAGARRSSNEGLYLITKPTGGQVFKNANDLTQNFRSLLKQQEVVYILGFQAPASGSAGKFHNIKVKTNVRGARVMHRAGYYEPSATLSALEQALSAGEILMNDVPLNTIPTSLMAAPFPVAGHTPQVPVIVEIDGKALAAAAKGSTVEGELFIYAFDREGGIRDHLYQKMALDLTKVGPSIQKNGVKYYGTLLLPAGDYAVKTLFRVPERDLASFRRVELTVPDFSKPAVLQPLVMEAPGQWLMVRSTKPGRGFDYPFLVGSDSFVPTAEWRLGAGSTQRIALFAYSVDPKTLAITGSLRDATGAQQPARLSLAATTPLDPVKGAQLLLELSTAGVTTGSYTLHLTVRPQDGSWSREFAVPITVQ